MVLYWHLNFEDTVVVILLKLRGLYTSYLSYRFRDAISITDLLQILEGDSHIILNQRMRD